MTITLPKVSRSKQPVSKVVQVTLISAALAIASSVIAVVPAGPASAWACASSLPPSPVQYGRPFPATWQGLPIAKTKAYSCGSHSGTDWDLTNGTQGTWPVWAVAPGTVTNFTDPGCYGLYTRLADNGGISTLYAHLQTQTVANGASVVKGQNIGWAGHTGTCPKGATHLHLAQTATWNGWYSASTKMFDSRAFLDLHGVDWLAGE
jgi:murein DD-endopeptidase MepM/ murein hydrolase activator NlpD